MKLHFCKFQVIVSLMKRRLGLLFLFLLLFLLINSISFAQEPPFITIETSQFKKTVIRVPDFSGEQGSKAAALLRRLFNYHLFLMALKSPPLPGFRAKEYYIKGSVFKENGNLVLQAELWDVLENKLLKTFKVYGKAPLEYLVYRLCDRVIENISSYKGLAETKIAFVKKGETRDSLYLIYFSKKHLSLLDRASLILFPKFSPSGKKLAYVVYNKKGYILKVLNLSTKSRKSISLKGISSAPVWSPDEKGLYLTLTTANKMTICYLDLTSQKIRKIFSEEGVLQVANVSPDGKTIAYVWDPGTGPQVYTFNLITRQRKRVSFEGKYNTSPRFLPKGNKLLYLSKHGAITTIIIKDLESGKSLKIDTGFYLEDPALSPWGSYLLAWGQSKKGIGFYLIHLDSGLSFLYLPGKRISAPTWAPF